MKLILCFTLQVYIEIFKWENVGQKLVKFKMAYFRLCKMKIKKHRNLRISLQITVFF